MIKAPSSFNSFIRKIFNNDEELSLNIKYIEKVQKENNINAESFYNYGFEKLNYATIELFESSYYKNIAKSGEFYIIVDPNYKGILVYYAYCYLVYSFISLESLRDYIRKNKIMLKNRKIKKDDSIKSRSELLELED